MARLLPVQDVSASMSTRSTGGSGVLGIHCREYRILILGICSVFVCTAGTGYISQSEYWQSCQCCWILGASVAELGVVLIYRIYSLALEGIFSNTTIMFVGIVQNLRVIWTQTVILLGSLESDLAHPRSFVAITLDTLKYTCRCICCCTATGRDGWA